MPKTYALLMAALSLVIAAPLMGQDADAKRSVPELIATLQSNASRKDKADACRLLSRVGTKEAVPVLAAMLADEEMHHMARYALEPIRDPSVDAALRAALGKLKGRPLVGVICSIGVRRDAQAVPLLAKLLKDADADVAQAAARSMGRVGTTEAAKALQDALPGTAGTGQLAVCEGLFRCAAALAAQGRRDEAIALYDRLRSLPGPHQVRAGATCAAIVVRQKDGLGLLAEQLRAHDYALFAGAVRAALEMPSAEVAPVLIAALGQLPEERQIPVIQALGSRRDTAAGAVLAAHAKGPSKPVRLAAICSLGELRQTAAIPVLLESLGDADRELAQAAADSLVAIGGREVDAAVMALVPGNDTSRRLIALDLIGRRRIAAGIPALLKAVGDSDAQVRAGALRRLGELGGASEVPALVDMLVRSKEPKDLSAVEEALSDVVTRLEHPESQADKVVALLTKTEPAQKESVLRVLGPIRGPAALMAVRASIDDPNADVQAAAMRVLAAWKTPDVVPELFAVAQGAGNPNRKMLALRAYLGWAGRTDLSTDQRLAICRQALKLAERVDQKRLLLSSLGTLDSPDAMALIVPFLADPGTKNEAAAAVVAAADRALKRSDAARLAPQLIEPLEKVLQAPVSPDLHERAKPVLQQAREKTRK